MTEYSINICLWKNEFHWLHTIMKCAAHACACVCVCVRARAHACMLIVDRNAFFQDSQPSMSPSSFGTVWCIVFKTCQIFVIYIKTCLCILPQWQSPFPCSIFVKVTTNQKTNTNTKESTYLTFLGHMQHFYIPKIPSWNWFILNPRKAFILILWSIERTFRWLCWAVFPDIQGPWNSLTNDTAEQVHRRLSHLLSVSVYHTPPSPTLLNCEMSNCIAFSFSIKWIQFPLDLVVSL